MKLRTILVHSIALLAVASIAIGQNAQIPQKLNHQGRVAVGGTNFNGTGQFKFALVDAGVNLSQTATGSVQILNGEVVGVTIISGGSGYTTVPVVTITGAGGGTGATAVATLGGGTIPPDSVSSITITNPGNGYTTANVTIAPPPPNIEYQTYWSNAGDLAPGEAPGTFVTLPVTGGLYSVRLGDTALPNMAAFNPDIFYTPLNLRVWFNDGVHGFQQLTPDQPLASAPYALQARLAETVPNGSIGAFQLANGAVSSSKLASGAVGATQLASGAISPLALNTGATPPVDGQGLTFTADGLRWDTLPMLPFAKTTNVADAAFHIVNDGAGQAILANSGGIGVWGLSSGANSAGVLGESTHVSGSGGFFRNTAGGDALYVAGKSTLDGQLTVKGNAKVRSLTIDNGADLAEPFAMRGDAEHPPGSVVVISDERPGELQLSHGEYDKRVAGIISGANGINSAIQLTQKGVNDVGGQAVALTGRVYVRADATTGAIKPGDLLTTSANPGHAMKASDHTRTQGAVLGKAMSTLDEGTGFVLVLVTLQ